MNEHTNEQMNILSHLNLAALGERQRMDFISALRNLKRKTINDHVSEEPGVKEELPGPLDLPSH
jgi:uncharacterized protein YpbB